MRDAASKRRIGMQVALAVVAVFVALGTLIIAPTTSIAGAVKPTYEITLTPVNPQPTTTTPTSDYDPVMPGPSPTPTFNGPRIILSLRPVQPGPSPVPTFNQTTSPSDTVQEVGVAQDLRRASASGSFACGLRTDGTARCWGVNDSGQLGIPITRQPAILPQTIANQPVKFTQISTGREYTCGLGTDKFVYCWGDNSFGQLGQVKSRTQLSGSFNPLRVATLPADTAQIATGGRHACALSNSGVLTCWGANEMAQVGNSTNIGNQLKPVAVMTEVKEVATGNDHTCALKQDGTVYCWGVKAGWDGWNDRLAVNYQLRPVPVSQLKFVSFRAAGDRSCAIAENKRLYCWGINTDGQAGKPGDMSTRGKMLQPELISSLPEVSQVYLGYYGGCAVTPSGSTYCWGRNDFGQLGPGIALTKRVAGNNTQIIGAAPAVSGLDARLGANARSTIFMGSTFTCMLDKQNNMYCVGNWAQGQLADGRRSDRLSNARTAQITPVYSRL